MFVSRFTLGYGLFGFEIRKSPRHETFMVLDLIEVRLGTRVGLRKEIAAPTEGECPGTRL